MPPPASRFDWDLNIVMPLGVLANQVIKFEQDLRFLSMRAAEHSGEDDVRSTKVVDARLEAIHQALESINALLLNLQADIYPKGSVSRCKVQSVTQDSLRKPPPELDD